MRAAAHNLRRIQPLTPHDGKARFCGVLPSFSSNFHGEPHGEGVRGFSKHPMNTTFRLRSIPSRPGELAMSLVCRWSGVSVELGLGERIPASLWDGAAKDLFLKNLNQDELHAVLVMDQIRFYALCKGCSSGRHVDSHDHFQCTSCKRVSCFSEEIVLPILERARITSAQVLLTGQCESCLS